MTFKPSKWAVPPPQDPQNRRTLAGLMTAVNELAGTVGARIQRAIRLGELLGIGLVKTNPQGEVTLNALGLVSAVRTTPDARATLGLMTVGPGFISGFRLYTDGQDVIVGDGIASIPALSYPVQLLSPATVEVPNGANQWYHIYLFVTDGKASVEVVTTAPSTPYSGYARSKAGDTTRRYLGSVRTSGSGVPLPMEMRGDLVVYVTDVTAAPFRVLTNGTNNTSTEVSCSAVVPVSGRIVHAYFTNVGTAGISFSSGAGITGFRSVVNPNDGVELQFLISASQSFYYRCEVGSPPANGLYADVWGYTLER